MALARVELDRNISADPQRRLTVDIYRPEGRGVFPIVVVLHGGGWRWRSRMKKVCRALAREGFVALNLFYSLWPKSIYPQALQDVQEAVRWARANAAELGGDSSRVSLWGYSAGGHLALLAGLDPALGARAIVAGASPTRLDVYPRSPLIQGFLGRTYQEAPALWRDASPVNHARKDSPPVFLYHGESDWFVTIDQMHKMEEALHAKGAAVESYGAPWLSHFSTYFLSGEAIRRGIAFLKKYN